jgi:hypothetical protein
MVTQAAPLALKGTVFVTGATGFIGRALVPALQARGCKVAAGSRRLPTPAAGASVEWRVCDLLRPETLPSALANVQVAYYLVHSMGGGEVEFRKLERRAAEAFASAAAHAGIERIVYLGGPSELLRLLFPEPSPLLFLGVWAGTSDARLKKDVKDFRAGWPSSSGGAFRQNTTTRRASLQAPDQGSRPKSRS